MATQIINSKGLLVIGATPNEIAALRDCQPDCHCCGDTIEDYGYIIPSLDVAFCHTCYGAWLQGAMPIKSKSEKQQEQKKFDEYVQFFEDVGTWGD